MKDKIDRYEAFSLAACRVRIRELEAAERERDQVANLFRNLFVQHEALIKRKDELEAALREIAKDTTPDPWGLARHALAALETKDE